jgi:hypothetical protein
MSAPAAPGFRPLLALVHTVQPITVPREFRNRERLYPGGLL